LSKDEIMSFKVISQKGCNALKNAVQVDLQDLEIYLKKGLKTIAISLEKDNNIYDICDFLKLKYKHENIVD
jgi:hypothetical protein